MTPREAIKQHVTLPNIVAAALFALGSWNLGETVKLLRRVDVVEEAQASTGNEVVMLRTWHDEMIALTSQMTSVQTQQKELIQAMHERLTKVEDNLLRHLGTASGSGANRPGLGR